MKTRTDYQSVVVLFTVVWNSSRFLLKAQIVHLLKVTPLERYVLFPDLNATLSDGLSRRCEKVGDMAELCVIA